MQKESQEPDHDEVRNLVAAVSEFISQQITSNQYESNSLSYQVQSKIESTRWLMAEHRTKLDELHALRKQREKLPQQIPTYVIELQNELSRLGREKADIENEQAEASRDLETLHSTLRDLETRQKDLAAEAAALFRRHRDDRRAWEKALALEIQPAEGQVTFRFTDLDQSFALVFSDAMQARIEAAELPQAVLGEIADRFNMTGSVPQVVASVRSALTARRGSRLAAQ